MRDREHDETACARGAEITNAERHRADNQRPHDPGDIEQTAHDHAAEGKSHHRQRERQRGFRARHGEFGLHGGQRHHHRPHADAADGRDKDRRGKA
jgi:hypothetical protein